MKALPWTAPLLWASASASYLIYSIPTGVFQWHSFAVLAVVTGLAVAWMRYTPPGLASDIAFFAVFAAVYLSRVLHAGYVEPFPKVQTQALAQLMCFRVAVTCLLQYRSHEDLDFGFLPTAAHWRIGLRYFLYFMPVAATLVWLLAFHDFRLARDFWWRAPVTFIGFLWGLGLFEECMFRGLILHRLRALMPSMAALAVSSLAFGITHLWFKPYPNWKFAILASVAGLFYGRAYLEGRSVRASTVAHALTVTAWRTFLA